MKEARRRYPRFALCGLNCGLCPMYHISESSHCTGCGGEGRPSCPILRCSEQHGHVEFGSLCADYPCERYQEDDAYDSFLPTRNVRRDLALLQEEGLDSYRTMLDEKVGAAQIFAGQLQRWSTQNAFSAQPSICCRCGWAREVTRRSPSR